MGLIAILLAALATAGVGAPSAPSAPCVPALQRGVLPAWARTGFSDPRPRMPHVMGDHGRIVAIIFGDPLLAPTAPDRSNKILWVARRTPQRYTTLRIRATQGTRTVTRSVAGGPGPSIVDLPAGCWHLDLRWANASDTLDLEYATNP
jgi:hypothetical protein